MGAIELGSAIFVILLFVIMAGVPVAFALGGVGFLGMVFLLEGFDPAVATLAGIAWNSIAHFTLCCVPLFIFMSEVISACGMSEGLFNFTSKWLSRLPGGTAIASIAACAIFGAICGSSVATAATIGLIAIPEMRKRGYSDQLATGATAAGGTLGILIPPSIPLIIYGIITENSIARLFAAGVVPGILLTVVFSLGTILFVKMFPKHAPPPSKASWGERFESFKTVWPAFILVATVLGSIYGGIATPTESAALGCFAAVLFAKIYYRRFDLKIFNTACLNTIKTTAMIGMIIVGAMLFGYLITALNIPQTIVQGLVSLELSRWTIMIVINAILFVLGMFLEVLSITVITVPILVPLVVSLGWDPVWFAIVFTINMELALVTPPVGLNLYVINGMFKDISMEKIIRGVIPFIIMGIIMLGIVLAAPQLSLWLPNLLYGK
jgi:C4-dicarboxylate transporter, DctM subunit